ncbi:MAG: serine/threonine protein kinase, partial [Myxococcales bacterium]
MVMVGRELIDLGLSAYERGLLDRERLTGALREASEGRAGETAETFWARHGLSREQLEQLARVPAGSSALAPVHSRVSEPAGPSQRPGDVEGSSIVIASSVVRDPGSTQVDEPGRATLVDPIEVTPERFKPVGVLGVGGMGEVLEVEDTRIGRRVAIKRVKAEVPHPERAAALLEREARVTGRLEHPNIVPLYDLGAEGAQKPFYVMRLLTHPTLAQVLQQVRRRDPAALAAYSLNRLVRCFVQVCRAVDYAHSRGVIHCDLKPANILVGPFGEVLVVDWGFCHIVGERRAQRGGTPGFLAPEQLAPETAELDARTDVFALGAVLYDILCLQHAFPILPMAFMVDAVRRGENPLPVPTPPSIRAPERRIAAELDEICLRALAFGPDQRFASARELADAVDAYLEGTREQERQGKRARELTEQGDMLAHNYRDLEQQAPERAAELGRLRSSVASWSSAADKQSLWDAEDREEVLQSVARRTFQAAVACYEHALEEASDHGPARLGLARIYWEALQRAQDRRADAERVYLESLVNQYDDGLLNRSARTVGGLRLRARGPVTGATLVRTSVV